MCTLVERSEGASIQLTAHVERVQIPAGLLCSTAELHAQAQEALREQRSPQTKMSSIRTAHTFE